MRLIYHLLYTVVFCIVQHSATMKCDYQDYEALSVLYDNTYNGNIPIELSILSQLQSVPPPNDMSCDAEIVLSNTNTPGTTLDATSDFSDPDCAADQAENSVWYTYTLEPGETGIEITIPVIGADVGPINVMAVDACTGTPTIIDEDGTTCDAASLTDPLVLSCLDPVQQVWIMVSTSDATAGDFEIIVEPIIPEPVCVDNDLCDDAVDHGELVTDEECTPITGECNQNACAEEIGDCGEVNNVVWYTVQNDGMGEFINVTIENAEFQTPIVAVFTGSCTALAQLGNCETGSGNTANTGPLEINPGGTPVAGEQYWIAVGSDEAVGGNFDICIEILAVCPNVPPLNDSPCLAAVTPPVDLSGGGSHDGTTCCANGFNDDPMLDYQNQQCSGQTDDDVVWYTFTPNGTSEGILVNLIGGTIQGNTALEIYISPDPNGGCNANLELVTALCGSLPIQEFSIPVCDPAFTYYFKVGSAEDNCGSFNISVQDADASCDRADDCVDAIALDPVTPPDCDAGENFFSIESCIELACPDEANTECENMNGATVWFQVNIDSGDPSQLITQVEANGFTPVWSVYQGIDCDNMTAVSQPQPAPALALPCSNSDGEFENNHNIPIANNPDTGEPYTYWIAVTGLPLPGETNIADHTFTLNYATSLGCLACSGENTFDCDNGEFTATVDGEEWDPDGDGVAGPFCPGQEVEVCWQFNYDTTGSGNDWLHGMIPSFGSGWDLESIDFVTQNIGGSWTWYDENDACYPRLQGYNLPNVCTYVEDGVLKLCNTVCNPGGCPCIGEETLMDGDPLPSGWFWNSPECGAGDCPHEEYGMPSGVNVDVNVCLTLSVKTFDSDEDCQEKRDLQIYIQTTSDAVTGCWNDQNPCVIDPSISSPEWEIGCDMQARVTGDEQTVCSGDMLDIDLEIEDGDIVEVVVEPSDNPSVEGETMNTFPAGDNPVINDVLINNSEVLQEVLYEVYTVDPTKPCPGIKDTVFVYVEPQIGIEFPVQELCAGFETTLDVLEAGITTGGTGNYVDFVWSPSLETTPSITVMPPVTTQYCVTVTDDFDCTGSTCVEVFVSSLIEFELVSSLEIACQDGVEDFNLVIDAVINSGTAPFNFDWNIPSGLDYTIENGDYTDSRIVFNEETSGIGTFYIDLTLYDAQNCEGEGGVELAIGAQPEIDLSDITICESQEVGTLIVTSQQNYMYQWSGENNSEILSNSFELNAPSGDYCITVTDVVGCSNIACASILSDSTEHIVVTDSIKICNSGDGVSTITLSDHLISGTGGSWYNLNNENFDLNVDTINFLEVPDGTYAFEYLRDAGPHPCAESRDTLIVVAMPCCYDINLTNNSIAHCSEDELYLNGYIDSYHTGSWTYEEPEPNPFINDSIVDFSGFQEGSYIFIWTLDLMQPHDECPQSLQLEVSLVHPAEIYLTGNDTVLLCNNDIGTLPTNIDLSSLIESNQPGYWYDIDDNQVDNFVDFAGTLGDTDYSYIFVSDQFYCEPSSISITILVQECECPTLELQPLGTHCSDAGILELSNYIDPDQPGSWSSADLNISNDSLDLSGVEAGSYTLTYTTDEQWAPACPNSAEVPILIVSSSTAGVALDMIETCLNTSPSINLFDLLENEAQDGIWTAANPAIDLVGFDMSNGTFLPEGNPVDIYEFVYTQDNPSPCADSMASVFVSLIDCDTLDCDFTLYPDSISISLDELYLINLLENDTLPDTITTQLTQIPEALLNTNYSDQGELHFEVEDNFFEPLELIYEVCTADCECKQMSLFIINEELEEIVPTNVFTPNGDGNNDQLRFTTSDVIPESELWIYNRWGDRIFHMKEYDNSWTADGYPAGIYYYVLEVRGNILKKTLTIVR